MLGTTIDDSIESRAEQARCPASGCCRCGLVEATKTLARPSRTLPDGSIEHGYEIHHGTVSRDGGDPLVADIGCPVAPVAGTLWHGLLENDGFRRDYLAEIACTTGRRFTVAHDTGFAAIRENKLDRLADLVADNLDRHAVHRLPDNDRPATPTPHLALEASPPEACN